MESHTTTNSDNGTIEYVHVECPDCIKKDAIIQAMAEWGTAGGYCDGWDEQKKCDELDEGDYKEGKCQICAIAHFTREVEARTSSGVHVEDILDRCEAGCEQP